MPEETIEVDGEFNGNKFKMNVTKSQYDKLVELKGRFATLSKPFPIIAGRGAIGVWTNDGWNGGSGMMIGIEPDGYAHT